MSISKIELKKQLQAMGIKVIKGNYVQKSDIKNMLASTWGSQRFKKAIDDLELTGVDVIHDDDIDETKIIGKDVKIIIDHDKYEVFFSKAPKEMLDMITKLAKKHGYAIKTRPI